MDKNPQLKKNYMKEKIVNAHNISTEADLAIMAQVPYAFPYNELVAAAAMVAKKVHHGQVDRGGEDYFSGHLTRVANRGLLWNEKIIGYLHDAVEDTPYTASEIVEMVMDEAIALSKNGELPNNIGILFTYIEFAINVLNKNNYFSREEYIEMIGKESITRTVKMYDLEDNMNLNRIPNPTPDDLERNERYQKEYMKLKVETIVSQEHESQIEMNGERRDTVTFNYLPVLYPYDYIYKEMIWNGKTIIPIVEMAKIIFPEVKNWKYSYEEEVARGDNDYIFGYYSITDLFFGGKGEMCYEEPIPSPYRLYDFMNELKIDYRGLIQLGKATAVKKYEEGNRD
jgi:hypothetical protein